MIKNVIMTGGTGFIGSWLIKELIRRNVDVTVITTRKMDDVVNQHSYIHYLWIEDYADVDKYSEVLLNGKQYDVFFHLGWAGVDAKDKNDIELQLGNINIAVAMLRLSKKLNCELFIGAGTVAEYVFNDNMIDFSLRQTPNDIYGATKTAVHYLLETIARVIKQNMMWIVLPSTYGEGRKTDNIISYTITSLLTGKKPLYGNLEQMWDFVYIEDVAKAIIEISEKGKPGKTYGIGSGVHKKLKEYICIIRDIIDPNLALGIGELQSKEKQLSSSCVNIDELKNEIGFVPCTSFEEGIRKTILYYAKELNVEAGSYK